MIVSCQSDEVSSARSEIVPSDICHKTSVTSVRMLSVYLRLVIGCVFTRACMPAHVRTCMRASTFALLRVYSCRACECLFACVCACVRVGMYLRVRACVCVCVCVCAFTSVLV